MTKKKAEGGVRVLLNPTLYPHFFFLLEIPCQTGLAKCCAHDETKKQISFLFSAGRDCLCRGDTFPVRAF